MKPRVLIIDDHNLFRKGLALLLSNEEFEVAGDGANGKEMIQILQKTTADVVLIDLQMPVMNGYESLAYLKENYPEIKCIALSMFEEEISMGRALDCGAHAYLSKDTHIEEIYKAIRGLMNEGYYFSDAVNKMLVGRRTHRRKITSPFHSLYVDLCDKEIRIIQLMAKGHNTMEIAAELHLSPRTVEGIRLQMISKTQAKNAVELVIFGVKSGLIEF